MCPERRGEHRLVEHLKHSVTGTNLRQNWLKKKRTSTSTTTLYLKIWYNYEKYNFVWQNSNIWCSCFVIPCCSILLLMCVVTTGLKLSFLKLLFFKLQFLSYLFCQINLMLISGYHGLILISPDGSVYYWMGSMENNYYGPGTSYIWTH